MNNRNLKISRTKIADFCRRRKITELSFFGSVLRDDFRPDSDIDVLVSFASDAHYDSFDLVAIQKELTNILGHKVDLIEKAALRNPFRRSHILNNREVVYVARRT